MTEDRPTLVLLGIDSATAEALEEPLGRAGLDVRSVPDLEALVGQTTGGQELVLLTRQALLSAIREAGSAPAAPGTPVTAEEKLRAIATILGAGASGLDARAEGASTLTPREREVVDLLANGARVVTIARHLGLSPHTVRNHLKSALRKLNLRGQHELFEYWRRRPQAAPASGTR